VYSFVCVCLSVCLNRSCFRLGYLTKFDNFILVMFVMIVGAIFLHQFTVRAMSKADRYPLRFVMVRVLECLGKLCVIPAVYSYFVTTFPDFGSDAGRDILFTMLAGMTALTLSREGVGLRRELADAIVRIRVKVESPTDHVLTTLELLVFNLYMFGVLSRSAVHYHRWKRGVDKDFADSERDARLHGGIVDPVVAAAAAGDEEEGSRSRNSSGVVSTVNPMLAAVGGSDSRRSAGSASFDDSGSEGGGRWGQRAASLPTGEADAACVRKRTGGGSDSSLNLEGSHSARPTMYEL
jgi:hypothetical protein